ncbi:MAG: mannonate dehydratase [Rhodothermales bacterium]
MRMTFRWYGPDDRVTLDSIRQIPGMVGIVSALYDIPPGEVWPLEQIQELKAAIEAAGLAFDVIESIPVHEDIKLGKPSRDALIENYCRSVEHAGATGIPVLCYNFMTVFDWTRTDLAMPMPDGSTALSYDHEALGRIDLSQGTGSLPGWATAYDARQLNALFDSYKTMDEEQLWDHLGYFLERVIPVAESAGVRMAIHPDDPPWSTLGLPRIIGSQAALRRFIRLVDSPANGVTLCTGSLGANPANDLPATIREIGGAGRIHFAHSRNVRVTGEKQFHESEHPSRFGSVPMREVMKAYRDIGFSGPMRPDHGRMIWGETGRAGYGLYDRALGAMYLQGLWEGLGSGG